MDCTIYWTDTSSTLAQMSLSQMIEKLPTSMQARAIRYKSEASACNYVAGRLLLRQGLEKLGLLDQFEKIAYQYDGKPSLPGVHFNISHSDQLVVCAFANVGALGIDIEKIKPIDFSDFDSMFSDKEWEVIKTAKDPLKVFYWYWTRKESIIKAVGMKLSEMHQIELDVTIDEIVLGGKLWFLKGLDIQKGYIGAICIERNIENIECLKIDF